MSTAGTLTICLAIATAASGGAWAGGGQPGEAELGIYAGLGILDDYSVGSNGLNPEDGSLFGLRFGMFLSENWSIEASGQRLTTETRFDLGGPESDIDIDSVRLNALFSYRPGRTFRPFLTVGVGRERLRVDGGQEVDPGVNLGGGLRWYATNRFGLRLDLRYVRVSTNALREETQGNAEAALGLLWTFGGVVRDLDADGVRDSSDRCPGTAAGARVDVEGCPLDSDRDGVYDGLDRCPGTPRGWRAGPDGCPMDADADSVPDGADRCPDTPAGARVDARGCPSDSDADGVQDGLDDCPDTPRGAAVDVSGCSLDSDGDGVPDGIDACPGTPADARVSAAGCPKDTDGDGVWDGVDRCEDTPPGSRVDGFGCAVLFEEQRRTLVLEGVTFETNSADLTPNARSILDRVAASLSQWPELRVEVGGHTDSAGRDAYNLDLSLRRAESVRAYLVDAGIPASRLTARGYGETRPVADNATEEGRRENRRVELSRLD